MIPLKCNNLNFSVKKFCCAFDHSEVRKYLLIQLYCELQNTKQKRGSRHICKMHRESHYCFQILSLASSITTLFPLTTIIPILFCPPALGNSMASLRTRFMNLVLSDAIEFPKAGGQNKIGMIVVRGNSVVMLEA